MDLHKSAQISSSASPGPRWGSPALSSSPSYPPAFRPNHSPVMAEQRLPYNLSTPPPQTPRYRNSGEGSFRTARSFGGSGGASPQFTWSPQFIRTPTQTFRTPQFQLHSRNDSPLNRPWTADRAKSRGHWGRFGNIQSPRSNPNMNPGGSNDISQYYSVSMLEDPWASTPALPVNHWLQNTPQLQNT